MRRALLVSPLRVAVAHRASSVSPRLSADALGVGQPGESLEALLLAARAALPLRMGEEASGEAEVAGGADASGREQPQRHPRRQAVLRVHEPGQVSTNGERKGVSLPTPRAVASRRHRRQVQKRPAERGGDPEVPAPAVRTV